MQNMPNLKLSSKKYVFLKSGRFVRRIQGTGTYINLGGQRTRVVTVICIENEKQMLVPVSSLQELG